MTYYQVQQMWGNNAILYVFIVFYGVILLAKCMFLKNGTTFKSQLNRLCNDIIFIANENCDTKEIIFFYNSIFCAKFIYNRFNN